MGQPAPPAEQMIAVGQEQLLVSTKPGRGRRQQDSRNLMAPVVLPPPQGGTNSDVVIEPAVLLPPPPKHHFRLGCLTCLQCLAPNATAAVLQCLVPQDKAAVRDQHTLDDEQGASRIDTYFAGADPGNWVDLQHQPEPSLRDKYSRRREMLWAPPGMKGVPLRRDKERGAEAHSVVRPTRVQNAPEQHEQGRASRTSARVSREGNRSNSCVGHLCELFGGVLYHALELLDDAVHKCTRCAASNRTRGARLSRVTNPELRCGGHRVNLSSDKHSIQRSFQGALQERRRTELEKQLGRGAPAKDAGLAGGLSKLQASVAKAQQIERNQLRDFRHIDGFESY